MHEEIRTHILESYLPGEEKTALSNDTALISGHILDSISTMQLVAWLEGKYGVKFAANEVSADNLDSINRIVSFIQSKS